MSHFTVLVIGQDPEEQLAGYHEFECTGHDDQHVINVDDTTEVQEQIDEYAAATGDDKVDDPLTAGLEYYGLEDRRVESEDDVDLTETHKYGYAVVKDGVLIKAVKRTNVDKFRVTICLGCATNPTSHAEGSIHRASAGDKVLSAMSNIESSGGFPEGDQEPRRAVHVLQTVPDAEKSGENSEHTTQVARQEDLRVIDGGLPIEVGHPEGSVCDMQQPSEGWAGESNRNGGGGADSTFTGSGPLSCDGSNSGSAMLELQQRIGDAGGQCEIVPCSDTLPHAPHETHRVQIGGSKWDWYLLGGRWTGFFKLKPGYAGVEGRPGVMTPSAKPGHADSVALEAIDVEGMRDEDGKRAGEKWDRVQAIIGDTPEHTPWSEFLTGTEGEGVTMEQSREAYWAQPRCAAWKASKDDSFGWRESPDEYLGVTREAFVDKARAQALSTFAVVKDGAWYERGKMGWFGCASDEVSDTEWGAQFAKLLDELPGDTLMSVYDCHI